MKPIFHAVPVNPPFEDPVVHVRIRHEGRALLFDCGDLHRLSPGQIMDISDVFVTHMHIDHFIGFDTVIRTILHREAPIRFYGPAGITDCIEGKLKGYTWNLIRDYPLVIKVYEIADGLIRRSRFAAPEAFSRVDGRQMPFQGVLLDEPLLKVSALQLSHGMPALGYRLDETFHINIRGNELETLGLPVGPWLADLKNAVREAAVSCAEPADALPAVAAKGFMAHGRRLAPDDLKQLVLITRGQSIAYIMDTSPTEENIAKIIGFVRGVDELFCEAYFLQEDIEHARDRHHLTAGLTGQIAGAAGVGKLSVLHISPRYRDRLERVFAEADGTLPANK